MNSFPDVADLIPHQPPMRLLDAIVECGESHLKATATIEPGCPFWTADGVHSCIGLEYLGQACAAYFALCAPESADTEPRPGMLIASRNYRSERAYFPAHSTLAIDISPSSKITPTGLVKFTGTLSDLVTAESFANGDLSVYLPRT